jgi:hypothetical protein
MHVGMRDKHGVESFDHVVYVHDNDSGISLYQANSFDFAPALSGTDPLTQNNLGPNVSKAHFKHDMDAQRIKNFDDYFKKIEKDGSQAIFTFTPASEVRRNYDAVENPVRPRMARNGHESSITPRLESENSQAVSPVITDALQIASSRNEVLKKELDRLQREKSFAQKNYQRAFLQRPGIDDAMLKTSAEIIDDLNRQISDIQQRMHFWSRRVDDLQSEASHPPYWYEKLQARDPSRSIVYALIADENYALDDPKINVSHNMVTTNHVDFFPQD